MPSSSHDIWVHSISLTCPPLLLTSSSSKVASASFSAVNSSGILNVTCHKPSQGTPPQHVHPVSWAMITCPGVTSMCHVSSGPDWKCDGPQAELKVVPLHQELCTAEGGPGLRENYSSGVDILKDSLQWPRICSHSQLYVAAWKCIFSVLSRYLLTELGVSLLLSHCASLFFMSLSFSSCSLSSSFKWLLENWSITFILGGKGMGIDSRIDWL